MYSAPVSISVTIVSPVVAHLIQRVSDPRTYLGYCLHHYTCLEADSARELKCIFSASELTALADILADYVPNSRVTGGHLAGVVRSRELTNRILTRHGIPIGKLLNTLMELTAAQAHFLLEAVRDPRRYHARQSLPEFLDWLVEELASLPSH